jgi:lactate dehydrogenase-like 2-hydroxyacid dehydrogenase
MSRLGPCYLRIHWSAQEQTPQDWGAELFEALRAAGGRAYSNYAVGYNNVKVEEATKRGLPVGNTPGNGHVAQLEAILD